MAGPAGGAGSGAPVIKRQGEGSGKRNRRKLIGWLPIRGLVNRSEMNNPRVSGRKCGRTSIRNE